jgi:putative zinc finger/helix-turn-helix YgiT family protein
MTCAKCGGPLRISGRKHHYVECGLPNVTLHGVEVRTCQSCGEVEAAIPNLEGLHACLAHAIVERRSAMTKEEFRFLRQFLGHSSQDFAKMLDVTPETMSRWQSGKHEIPRSVDLLVRFLVSRSEPRIDYTDERISKMRPRPARPPKIELRVRQNAWRPDKAA